jgi:hypothetical protein
MCGYSRSEGGYSRSQEAKKSSKSSLSRRYLSVLMVYRMALRALDGMLWGFNVEIPATLASGI